VAIKLQVSKTKTIIAFILVLCLAIPFLSSISSSYSSYIMTAHTHVCHDEEHKDDCAGTKECCQICQSIDNMKNRPGYYIAASKLPTTSMRDFSLLTINFEFQHILHISPVSLKVCLNN